MAAGTSEATLATCKAVGERLGKECIVVKDFPGFATSRLDFAAQPAELRLPLLRAWQLTFTRLGKPDAATCARLAAKLDPLFPHADRKLVGDGVLAALPRERDPLVQVELIVR